MTKGAAWGPLRNMKRPPSWGSSYFLVVFFAAAVFLAGAAFFAAPAFS